MTGHAEKAAAFAGDEARTHWHDDALWFIRVKRDRQAASIPEWESLREAAAAIKAHTLSRLADYLEEFERNAIANGMQVHWARDAEEHNAIVHGILARHGVTRLVKSKSMLTEECHLNPFLERHGVEEGAQAAPLTTQSARSGAASRRVFSENAKQFGPPP